MPLISLPKSFFLGTALQVDSLHLFLSLMSLCVFLVLFFTSDFMKNDVIPGFLTSLSDSKGGNGNSSLSLSGPSPKIATFLPCFHGSTFSIVVPASYV